MKLPFGFEITRRPSASRICLESAPVAISEFPGLYYRNSSKGRVYSFRKNPPSLSIVWPEPPQDMNPELVNLALAGLVVKIEKMLGGNHFDVCPITSIVSDFEIDQSRDAGVAMDILRSIHCIDYRKLPKGIVERIPELLSCVFTGGAYPLSRPDGATEASQTEYVEAGVDGK